MMQQRKMRVMMDGDAGYVPAYAHETDAGLDLKAVQDYVVPAHGSVMVRTGCHVELPSGCFGIQAPRSGLGSRGITMRNAIGVIDNGYRGEILCALWNTTDEEFRVAKGDRICQLVVLPYVRCDIDPAESLSDSDRGADGYGSTGVK